MIRRRRARSGRPEFVLELDRAQPPTEVWSRLWDLDRHTAAIPFTRVGRSEVAGAENRDAVPGPGLGPGSRFVARTALGPLGFDDAMSVREWDPPRRAVIEKVGRPLRGTITATLEPHGTGTRLTWRQSFGAAGIPNGLARLAAPAVRAGYWVSLGRILAGA